MGPLETLDGGPSSAGKLGHTTSVPNDRLCECGRRGCLMAHAAEPYMLDQWQSRSGSSISRDEFARSVERQEDLALSILSDCGSRIGRHLADMVNLFDPEIIVVGGEAVQFGDALLDPVRKTMEEFVFFTKPELVADWVPSSSARGAAALATQNIFDFERSPSG
nr:ROK family protein [Rhizobium mongolense]